MFLQYTKYRDIDAVTWHDACHVTKSPRLSLALRLAYRSGQRSYVKLLRGRREEPGNEATVKLASFPGRFFPPPQNGLGTGLP